MKKLGKLLINPEKVMNNDELISLRGGYGGYGSGSCGEGFDEYCCLINPCSDCAWIGPATVCVESGGSVVDKINEIYPDNGGYSCGHSPC